MADTRIFKNGRVFATSDPQSQTAEFASCLVTRGKEIAHVGHEQDADVQEAINAGAEVVDLNDRVVIPGFIDAHTHILFFGLSRRKLDLTECNSLEELRTAISAYAKSHPELPRILCRGWRQPVTGRLALATMLDGIDPRPIYLESLDLHSHWVSSAALAELPLEGALELGEHQVARDADGNCTGLFAEAGQVDIVWKFLNSQYTEDERQAGLQSAFDAYLASGYTGVIDMAMDHHAFDSLKIYRERNGRLPLHLASHWLITPPGSGGTLAEKVDEAIAMMNEWSPSKNPDFCVIGVKIICDGTIDGCTAALSIPYPSHDGTIDALWPAEDMNWVVSRCATAGLQVAVHAIGDSGVTQAVNAIAAAKTPHARHRIEHLEVTCEEDAKRLGQLGITASVQPVHSDPAILQDYPKLVGPELWERSFAYKEFLESGACVAFGTDTPTASHLPMPNLYNATTRKSAMRPEMTEQTIPRQAFTMSQAFYAATSGAAYSRFAETWTGSLKKGLRADFTVLDSKWTKETLLQTEVEQTWTKGQLVYSKPSSEMPRL